MFFRKRRRSADQRIMDRARQARKDRLAREGSRDTGGSSLTFATTEPEQGGGKGMIRVTRLNGDVLYLNLIQIQGIRSIPETKIKMMNGDYYLVQETPDSIIEQMRAFFGSCFTGQNVIK